MERVRLKNLLNAVVCSCPGDVYYYQGLHDIASVLLFVVGERPALPLLRRLAICHLRDCTRWESMHHCCAPLSALKSRHMHTNQCTFMYGIQDATH